LNQIRYTEIKVEKKKRRELVPQERTEEKVEKDNSLHAARSTQKKKGEGTLEIRGENAEEEVKVLRYSVVGGQA